VQTLAVIIICTGQNVPSAEQVKPIVMSEIGIPKTYMPYGQPALSVLSSSVHQVNIDGYSGWLIWNWSEAPDTSFGFSPQGNQGFYTVTDLQRLLH
jgi:hypothetical protein